MVVFKNSINLVSQTKYLTYTNLPTFSLMVLPKKPRKLLAYSCCVETKGHTCLSKPVGKSSKSTKSEVFLKEVFNKFEDIGT